MGATGFKESALYHYPNGNIVVLFDLDSSNQPVGSLTDGSTCALLGHIEKDGMVYEEDFSNLKTFKNNLDVEVGSKVQESSGVYTIKLMQKDDDLMAYLRAKTGVQKLGIACYFGIIDSTYHWKFSIVRIGSKIREGSDDGATELTLRAVAPGSAVTWDTSDMSALETALTAHSLAIHPTQAVIAANTYCIDTYTAVS